MPNQNGRASVARVNENRAAALTATRRRPRGVSRFEGDSPSGYPSRFKLTHYHRAGSLHFVK